MVHGMEDKVVDIKHSLKMAKKLTSAKILFQQQVMSLAVSYH
jgi:dipeptidyl aminopeptidase/acylaminoacyl peptidase